MGFIRHLFYEQYCLSVSEPTASFSHKTVIITGSNGGLGKEAARHVARLKCARLILGVRNTDAGAEARKDLVATTGIAESSVEVWPVDLSSFASVRDFTDRASRELERLDVLICNAGINKFSYAELQGYESMLTVNVLSTYLMAKQLLPLLQRSAAAGPAIGDPDPRPPHLTIVGSDTHLMATVAELSRSQDEILTTITANCRSSKARLRQQYAYSKLLILLLGRDIVYRQLRSGPSVGIKAVDTPERQCGVIINITNPGLCYSNLVNEIAGPARVMQFVCRARSAAMGGSALVNAACAGWETNGQFLSSDRVHMGSDASWDSPLGEKLARAIEEGDEFEDARS